MQELLASRSSECSCLSNRLLDTELASGILAGFLIFFPCSKTGSCEVWTKIPQFYPLSPCKQKQQPQINPRSPVFF